jgi:hypothetical protein
MAYGPLKSPQGELVVISRREAADSGRLFFYTGKPCKHGHNDVRYVTTGACRACLRSTYTPRINPWTNKLVPFTNNHLWTAAHFTKAQRVALRVYLQHCIFAFVRKNIGDLTFNGKVELEAAMQEIEERGRWANAEDPRNTD